jgi:ABC-type polysaccharide/polyol phosphate transport system ATPase subunit
MSTSLKPHYEIKLEKVSLEYERIFDRTSTLKEWVTNLLHRRKYVQEKKVKFLALNEIDLTIHEGERLGIIGLNGAGKSTLLKVISGILKPSAGKLTVRGTIQPLIEIGAGFNPEFSGRENIYLNGYMLGFTKAEIKAKEQEIIEYSELGEFIDNPVKYYSSGMSVRLAFTIATSISPEILVFDEMLAAGDAKFMEKAKKRIDSLVNEAKMLVIVSHDLELIKRLCTRCILVEKGKIIFDGDPETAVTRLMA